MNIPDPRPGLVIRYGFLWSHEADEGAEDSTKDRPCAIVVAARRQEDNGITVVVAPITREQPADPGASMEIPENIVENLGLKAARQWLRFDELNRFTWPGYDLRTIPGREQIEYGMLPGNFFERLRSAILHRQKTRQARRPTNRN